MFIEFIQKLKNFDLMTPPIQLNIGGKSGVKTFFGVMMTILYLVALLSFSYIIIINFFSTTSPTVTEEVSQHARNPRVDMIANNLFPVVYVLAPTKVPITAKYLPRFVTITYNKYRLIEKFNANGTLNVTYDVVVMPAISCEEALKNETLAQVYNSYLSTEFFSQHGRASGFCPQFYPNESFVQGGGSEPNVDVLTLQIYPCNLPNASECASASDILGLSILVTQPSSSITMSNYTNPVKSYLNADVNYFINTLMSQRYFQIISETEIWDESQIFWTSSLRTQYNSIESTTFNTFTREATQVTCGGAPNLASSNCNTYLSFQYSSGPVKHKYSRAYKTLTQTLSQIGGINSMSMLIFVYINLIYNYYAKKTLLVEGVFKFFKDLGPTTEPNKLAFKSPRHPPMSPTSKKRKTTISYDGSNEMDKFQSTKSKRPEETQGDQSYHLLNPLARLNKKEIEVLRDEAFEVILKNLDVITLVREINNLKVLTHLLFKDYQQKLMPLISLNIQAKKDRLKKDFERQRKIDLRMAKKQAGNGQEKGDSSDLRNNRRSRSLGTFLELGLDNFTGAKDPGGYMSFNTALILLEDSRKEIESVPKGDWTLEQKIEMFCYEGLEHKKEPPSPSPATPLEQDSLKNPKQKAPKDLVIRELVFGQAGESEGIGTSNYLSQEVDEMAVAHRAALPATALQTEGIQVRSNHTENQQQDLNAGSMLSSGISSKAVRELERKLEKKGILN